MIPTVLTTLLYVLTLMGWGLGLYFFFGLVTSSLPCLGPKKLLRQAAKSPFDQTVYTGKVRDGGPDRVSLLESPVEGLGLRLELFAHATRSLDVVCHTIHAGGSTSAFFAALLDAADRGVNVRILLDGKASSIRPSVGTLMRAMLAHPNIQCRQYNPAHPLKPWKWHFLMHDKYILADGAYLLMGGRNLGDKFFAPDSYGGKISNDRDVLVHKAAAGSRVSSAVDQAQAYFNALWAHRDVNPLRPALRERGQGHPVLEALRADAAAFRQGHPVYFQQPFAAYLRQTIPTSKVTLLHNPIQAGHKAPWIWQQLQRISLGAKASVLLQTPYITANQGILSAFGRIAARVPFSILTNSPASTPNFPAYSNYFSHRRRFIRTGAQIYEYQSKHSIHGKAMVVDGRLGIMGSFNMDDRSMHLDTEIMLVVDSEAFAGMLQQAIGAYQRQSLCVNESNTYHIPDGHQQVAVPRGKIPLLRFVSLFSKPLRSFI